MKNELLSVLCITFICATLMLGVMGLYRLIGSKSERFGSPSSRHIHSVEESFELSDTKIDIPENA